MPRSSEKETLMAIDPANCTAVLLAGKREKNVEIAADERSLLLDRLAQKRGWDRPSKKTMRGWLGLNNGK
jgi:hypothetical protein